MQFDPTQLLVGFDWTFRPATYFLPDAPPPPEPLPDWIRDAFGQIHHLLLGGLYLPAYLPGEVETARVYHCTLMGDVLSVRARPHGKRIAYRVVDEYKTQYPVRPASSARPLTLAEITSLMDGADRGPDRGWGIALGVVQKNAIDEGRHLNELRTFVSVTSAFYPELGPWYDKLINAWLDAASRECRHG